MFLEHFESGDTVPEPCSGRNACLLLDSKRVKPDKIEGGGSQFSHLRQTKNQSLEIDFSFAAD